MAVINFIQVLSGIDVNPLLKQIEENSKELWGKYSTWTDNKESAITKMGMAKNYIELCYNKTPDGKSPHPKHWAREPFFILTEAQKIIYEQLIPAVKGIILGRVCISRMQPGEVIVPHVHLVQFGIPKIFDTFQIPLQVDKGVIFKCGNDECYMPPGTGWTFNNQIVHSVENNSNRQRISMMVDICPLVSPFDSK